MNTMIKTLQGLTLAATLAFLALPGVAEAGNGFNFNPKFQQPTHNQKFHNKKFAKPQFSGFGFHFGNFHLHQANFRHFDFDPHHFDKFHFQHQNQKFHNFNGK